MDPNQAPADTRCVHAVRSTIVTYYYLGTKHAAIMNNVMCVTWKQSGMVVRLVQYSIIQLFMYQLHQSAILNRGTLYNLYKCLNDQLNNDLNNVDL